MTACRALCEILLCSLISILEKRFTGSSLLLSLLGCYNLICLLCDCDPRVITWVLAWCDWWLLWRLYIGQRNGHLLLKELLVVVLCLDVRVESRAVVRTCVWIFRMFVSFQNSNIHYVLSTSLTWSINQLIGRFDDAVWAPARRVALRMVTFTLSAGLLCRGMKHCPRCVGWHADFSERLLLLLFRVLFDLPTLT